VIEIIQGGAHDVAAIMPIMDGAFDPAHGEAWTSAQCISALSLPQNRLLLAMDGSELAGFALSRWVMDEEELLMIAIAPPKQGFGSGRILLNAVVRNAASENRAKLFLEVRDGNAAIQFYNAAGFAEIGRRKQYYQGATGICFDAISMMKIL
jgi:[ribosomal protein S18]-alanine N-acetyltransferase